ncbi:hypothetical protein AB4K20DRAFT_1794438, partial [Rhizopus microsporus]
RILRKLAEEFSLLRADTMNLVLLIISNWIEKAVKKTSFHLKVAQDLNGLNSRIKVPSNDRVSLLDSCVRPALLGFLMNAKEQQNSTYNERSIANKVADGVIQYEKFEDLDIEIDSVEQYYKKILGIYIDIFDKEKYEKISDYDYTKNNSYKLLWLSSQLLKEAAKYNVKTWSTLTRPSHGIVFAPLSGSDCMYGLLEQAHKSNLKIPAQCLTEEYSFETHRNIAMLRSISTMAGKQMSIWSPSSLKEKLLSFIIERIPQDEEEMNLLKRVNLTNWRKGLYLLTKEPMGLSMTDRIIGIDPGFYGIFVMVDGASEDVNNKKTVKQRSVKFANNE